ncbi:MAG: serine hydrolase domain-containing protein [Aggregatilineales bacterium]
MIHSTLDAQLRQLLNEDAPGAGIGVMHAGETIHSAGYGLANVEWHIPIDTDTAFRVGSVTKPFTALLTMMLVADGQIALDAPITDYLPEFHSAGHIVTVHHLLTHTSGIASYTNAPDFFTHKCLFSATTQEMLTEIAAVPFEFKPGTAYNYNNSGYHLLGMIIERVTGMGYADFLRERILTPCAMHNTLHPKDDSVIPRMANGYRYEDETLLPANYLHISRAFAAGALITTVNDLLRWSQKLWAGEIVPLDTLTHMGTSAVLENGEETGYGYGWGNVTYEGRTVMSHSGGIPGFSAQYVHFVEDDLTIIVLANVENTIDTIKLVTTVAREMFALPAVKHRLYMLVGDNLRRIIGAFETQGATVTIKIDDEGKIIWESPMGTTRLIPINKFQLYDADNPERTVTFSDPDDSPHALYTQIELQSPLSRPVLLRRIL